MPQDPRLTEDALECVEMFFQCVAANSHDQITEFLELEPTLAYARDEDGDTALYYATARGREANIETARILMAHGAEPGPSNVGTSLQLIADLDMMRQMAEVVGIHIPVHHSSAYTTDQYAASRVQEDAYFNSRSTQDRHKTIDKIAKTTTYTALTSEPTYGEELNNLFKNMNPLNMYEQEKFDQMSFESSHPLLKGISFAPMMFEKASSNDLSIIVIPKEIVDFGYEQFTNTIGKLHELYDQYFGHSND